MNSTRHSFTLIELLVVVVLISMLVGVTVPVYTRVMTGNAVSYGMRQVVSQLNMARVEACRARRPVAVVFLIERGDVVNDVDDSAGIYNRRAFRACYVNDSNVFQEWIPGTTWQTLPKGAFFVLTEVENAADDAKYKVDGENVGGFVGTGVITDVLDDRNIDAHGNPNPNDRLFPPSSVSNPRVPLSHAIVFDATGRLASTAHVVIAEGSLNAYSPTTRSMVPLDPTLANLEKAKEDSSAGRAIADRLDNIRRPNIANWAKCTVNGYTGRITTRMHDDE